MAIFLTENSKVVVQGMTGSEGQKHTRRMLASGTQVVGGVNPRKAGESVDFDLDFTALVNEGDYNAVLTFNTSIGNISFDLLAAVVPEPSTLVMLGLGACLAVARRRRLGRDSCDLLLYPASVRTAHVPGNAADRDEALVR